MLALWVPGGRDGGMTRIIEADGMVALLEAMEHSGAVDEDEMAAFARRQRGTDG